MFLQKSLKIQESKSPDAKEEKPQAMPAAEPAKPVDTAAQEEYPGLYGPVETKPKRRRPRSIEPPLSPTGDVHAEHDLTKDGHSMDTGAAVDSLMAKKDGDRSKMQEDENLSPRSPRSPRPRKTSEKDDDDVQAPLSPSTKKVMPKIALVKLADGLKSQAVELSPRTQRKQDMAGQEDKDADRRSPRGGRGSPRGKQEIKESTSPSESKEIKLADSKNEKLKPDEKEDKGPASPDGQAKSRRKTSPEKQPSLRSKRPLAGRTLSSETLPVTSLMSSSHEKEPTSIRMEMKRRTSVEDLRGMIERRQCSFSTETAESDQEPQSNAKNALESRRPGRILPERRDSSESVGSNKQAPTDKREPVLMRNHKPVDKSVSSLRRKFAVQEFGSTPNVSDLSILTGRKEKERPKEGCVKQMTQAFSLVSLNDQGAEMRRSSKSSSVRSSPQSLSPASSNSSISNVVANQIKRLQEKASSSPESPERRPSVQTTRSPKDSGPSLYSIHGRLEHRKSLTNVADVRAKFDKKKESVPNTDSPPPSPSVTKSPSPQRRARKENTAKPSLVSSVAAARIKYTVSVSNSVDSGPPKKSVSMKENGSARTQRLVAVMESPNTEKTGKADSNVTTFTVNGQKRRQNSTQSSARHEENNNNSNNNNRNNSVKVDVRRKGSCTNPAEVSNKPADEKQGKRDKDNEDSVPSRRASVTKNDRRRGSLPRQTDPPRDASRRGSVTKGKESPKEAARRRSVSKESQKSVSRRGSLSKGQDSSNESCRGKAASKDAEPSKEASSLHVPGAEPEEDDRGRRRRRRRERNTPSPEPTKAQAEADVKMVSNLDIKSEVKPKVNTTVKPKVRQEVKEKEVKQDILKENQPAVKIENKQSDQQKVKPEVKTETKTETKHGVKSEVKSEAKHDVKPVPNSEAKPEVKVEVKPDREQERKNRREERARRQKEREEEAARVKAEKEKEDAKKAAKVVRKESKEEKRELRKEKIDLKKKTTSELTQPVAGSSASHSIRRRHSKREEPKPSEVLSKVATAEVAKSEEEEPMPDLLAQAQKKTAGESATAEDMIGGRSPRAILTNSALRGAEAVIGHALPKSTPDEEESKEDPTDERRSRKDATRRSRAINRGSRISRLDIFRRARSVDISKASKDRSPDRLLGGSGASDRSRSVDRSGKNRDKSPGGEETRKGGSWLSKRTGSISNFLRPSK